MRQPCALAAFICLLLATRSVEGDQVVVASPGEGGDVQPALADAIRRARPGDEVILPAGNFRLEGPVDIDLARLGPVTLRGQGKNRTRLFKTVRGSRTRYMIGVVGASAPARSIEVTGLTFESAPAAVLDAAYEHDDIGLRLKDSAGFTIHHCRFTSFGHAAIQVRHDQNQADGLIYNNEFVNNHHPNPRPDPVATRGHPSSLGYGVEVRAELQEEIPPADAWRRDVSPGTEAFIFVEDNYFSGHRHAVAGGEGGLYVFRNNLAERQFTAHGVDAHGAGKFGNIISTRFYEVYRNRVVSAAPREAGALGFPVSNFALAFRGGEGVVFCNTLVGFPNGIRLAVELNPPSYPAFSQIGWESATNHEPNPDPDHRGVVPPLWYRGDLFLWENRFEPPAGTAGQALHADDEDRDLLIVDRDYHLRSRPGYTPYRYPHPRALDPRRLPFPDGLDDDNDGDRVSNLDEFFRDTDPNRP